MLSGTQASFTSTRQLTKTQKPITTEKDVSKGHGQKESSTKQENLYSNRKKGFVRLDSFEDYEVIDPEMVKNQFHISKSASDCSLGQSHEDKVTQMNCFDSRLHHPASFNQLPYPYSNQTSDLSFQGLPYRTPHPNCQSTVAANYFNHWQSSCNRIPDSTQLKHQYNFDSQNQGFAKSGTGNLNTYHTSFGGSAAITHHVPYNLTKGHYEYWMSLPGGGSTSSNFEAMQAYSPNQPINSVGAKHLPAQISRTVSSWFGGIYDWVASSVDSALKPAVSSSENITFQTTKQLDLCGNTSHVTPLNPNAKVFTPHATLNPYAKEFCPSIMTSTEKIVPKQSCLEYNSISKVGEITNSASMDNTRQEVQTPNSSHLSTGDTDGDVTLMNESESDLSQIVIEKLINIANEEQRMEKLQHVVGNVDPTGTPGFVVNGKFEVSDCATPTVSITETESNQLQLKSIALRKTTPWIIGGQRPKTASHLETEVMPTNSSATLLEPQVEEAELDDVSGDSDMEGELNDDDFEESFSPTSRLSGLAHIRSLVKRKQSASSSCDDIDEIENSVSNRFRSLSTCSDDSNFIEFGDPSTSNQSSPHCDSPKSRYSKDASREFDHRRKEQSTCSSNDDKSINSKQCASERSKRCLIKAFVVDARSFMRNNGKDGNEEETETDVDSDSDDDQDWDEVDGDDDKVTDDELWASFKAQVLVCPMSSKKLHTECHTDGNSHKANQNNQPSNIGINMKVSISFLPNESDQKSANDSGSKPTKKTPMEIRDANKKWNSFYNISTSETAESKNCLDIKKQKIRSDGAKSRCTVTIAPEDSFVVIYEDPNLSAELQKSRNGDYSCGNLARRDADKERMERLLSPIFKEHHRQKVWERLQEKVPISEAT